MAPRYYRPDFVYEVARRTVTGDFLFDLNDKALMTTIVGALALAQRRHGIEIYHFHLMSNHYHGLFNAPSPAQLARFLNLFHGLVGSAVNQRLGRKGPVWTRKFRPIPVTPDARTLMRRMKYLTGQAVRARLVQHPAQFPGPSAVDWLIAGVPLRGRFDPTLAPLKPRAADNPSAQGHGVAQQPQAEEPSSQGALEVKISILPCFQEKAWTDLHRVFAAQADELAEVPLAALLERGGPSKVPSVDLALAGADEPEEGDPDESPPEPAVASDLPNIAAQSEVSSLLPAKLSAPDAADEQTGELQSRPGPNSQNRPNRRREPLAILSADPTAREAYRACLDDFLDKYDRAMRRLAAQLARSARGLRVRAVKFPPFALLPSCIEGRAG